MRSLYHLLLGVAIGFSAYHIYVSMYPEHTLLFYEGYTVGLEACKVLEGTSINQPRPLAHSARKAQP